MERLSSCEMKEKEVVNVCDGRSLGSPADFEFDAKEGRICSLILCRRDGLFFRGEELIIPWSRIECIGEDKILVRLKPEEAIYEYEQKRKKNLWNL